MSYDAMVSELTAIGVPREKAEARALAEYPQSAPPTPEADEFRIEKQIVAAADKQLRSLGFRVINTSQPRHAKFLTPGIPDRIYFHRTRRLCVLWEAKTPAGKQSPAQKDFQDDCEACGWPYVLGTDHVLYAWLIDRGIAVRDPNGYLTLTPTETAA